MSNTMSDMASKDLLIELGSEELPPKALSRLSKAYTDGIVEGLDKLGFAHGAVTSFAAPRRLAVSIADVQAQQPDQEMERRGPAVQAAFDADGNPKPAATGFAKSCGVEVADLQRQVTDKGEWLMFKQTQPGKNISDVIGDVINESLRKLPIPKRMRWGDNDEEFVRPVHWLVVLHGEEVLDCEVLALKAGRATHGHRFHHPEAIDLGSAGDYQSALMETGKVLANFADRRQSILDQVNKVAASINGQAILDEDLLDEVAGLVEWPVALSGSFDQRFLDVPSESIVSSLQEHQKVFAVTDADGNLMANFIAVANIESKDPIQVREGNERVIRPRLSDAEFFWNQDKKKGLASFATGLEGMTFQKQLGSLADKQRRVTEIAEYISAQIGGNGDYVKRACELAKCDLLSNMVFEFTDLQGIMGRYYALNDGEPEEVALAIEEQYLPKFAGDKLPSTKTGTALALAERIDTLVGIFAIGQKPTGTKDPFGLRRAGLGVLRGIIEAELELDLAQLVDLAASQLADKVDASGCKEEVIDYLVERLRVYYTDNAISVDVYEAVLAQRPTRPLDFDRRVRAIAAFRATEAGQVLAAANKRTSNILKKAEMDVNALSVDPAAFAEVVEKALWEAIGSVREAVLADFDQGQYADALGRLAVLKEPVDAFFDGVMVMDPDEKLRDNRLAMLNTLAGLFIGAGDLSRLQS